MLAPHLGWIILPIRKKSSKVKTIVVTCCGRICLGKKKINFSQVFAGQVVGIKEVHDDIWLVSFMDYDLGYFDLETRVLEPLENPFGPKVLPIS
jgi:putative transposase